MITPDVGDWVRTSYGIGDVVDVQPVGLKVRLAGGREMWFTRAEIGLN